MRVEINLKLLGEQQINKLFHRRNGDLRIIGAISIDLHGATDEANTKELDEEAQVKVSSLKFHLDEQRNRIRILYFQQVFQAIVKEFCANSTVHGVRYLAERKRHWIER